MPSNLGQHTQCNIHVALMITTVTLYLCSITLTMKTSESWLAATTVSFPFFYHTHTSVFAGIWIAIIHWKEEMKWQKRNAIQFFINDFFSLIYAFLPSIQQGSIIIEFFPQSLLIWSLRLPSPDTLVRYLIHLSKSVTGQVSCASFFSAVSGYTWNGYYCVYAIW